MKRDMDLIRLLLQKEEGEEPKPDLSKYSEAQVLYHLVLMEEAGLIVAVFSQNGRGEAAFAVVKRLTNAGHDLLDSMRSETVWAAFKKKATEMGGAISLPIAVEVLKLLVKKELGLP